MKNDTRNVKELNYGTRATHENGFLLVPLNSFLATWTTYNDVCPAYQTEDRVTKFESFCLNSYLAASNLRL